MDERYLLDRLKKGDEKIFGEVYYSYQKKVLFFVNQYVKDINVAYDITQDTFVSLWQYRENINIMRPLTPYLLTIAKNKSLNYLRQRINFRDNNLSLEQKDIYSQFSALSDSTADLLITKEIYKIVDCALDKMPAGHKKAYIMSRKENLKYEEIALLCDISVKTVEFRISSVLRILRQYLKEYINVIILLMWLG